MLWPIGPFWGHGVRGPSEVWGQLVPIAICIIKNKMAVQILILLRCCEVGELQPHLSPLLVLLCDCSGCAVAMVWILLFVLLQDTSHAQSM